MLKIIVKIVLITISLSMFMTVSPVANADDTYERICLTLGWTSCGEWTIYDANGVIKNRVVGPTPLSAVIAVCGVNLCGGGLGGYAVQTGTYSPPTSTELADRAAAAEAARAKAETLAIEAARVAAASDTRTVISTPSAPPTPTPTPTPTNTSGVTGIDINMFDLQGTSLYARYCIQGSGQVSWFGSIKTVSTIKDASGKIFSEKTSQWGTDGFASGMSGDCNSYYAYDEIKSGFIPGSAYTLTVNSAVEDATHSLTKTFTIAGGSTSATKSTFQPIPAGLGGYAVIHPDGHVCGVMVANGTDPFGNGGVMTTEYMGCPVGALIIFQTKPSPSGNVAGWHGPDVFYFKGIFILGNGTTISNGIATDPNGRVWDTGSGETIKAGVVTTPVQSETKTGTTQSETKTGTTQSETKTATTQSETKTGTTQSETNTVSPQTNAISTNIQSETKSATTSDAIKNQQSVIAEKIETVIDSDGEEVVPEANLKVKKDNSGRITFTITSNLPEEAVIITASKKGSKSIRYSVTTNDSGRALLRTTRNLSGYTLTLRFDSEVLDQLKFK